MVTLLIAIIIFIKLCNGDEWSGIGDPCKEGGQCATMMRGYEALVEGDGCRSFFTTGKCATICAFSLKSLIGRRTWSRCAHRCEWAPAVMDAADSWLSMCLSRSDQHNLEETNNNNSTKQGNNALNNDVNTSGNGSRRIWRIFHKEENGNNDGWMVRVWAKVLWRSALVLIMISGCISAAAVVVAVQWRTPVSVVARKGFRNATQWASNSFNRFRDRFASSSKKRSRGVLEPGRPRGIQHGSSLNRGARRHLKSLRANNID